MPGHPRTHPSYTTGDKHDRGIKYTKLYNGITSIYMPVKPGNKNQMLGIRYTIFEFVVEYASMIPLDTVSVYKEHNYYYY